MTSEKVVENRLRRMAKRQGFVLQKCRARDPRAIGYGTFRLVNASTNIVETAGWGDFGLSEEDVEKFLLGR